LFVGAIALLQLLPQVPAELMNAVQSVTSAPALADLIASFMDITASEKQEILEPSHGASTLVILHAG